MSWGAFRPAVAPVMIQEVPPSLHRQLRSSLPVTLHASRRFSVDLSQPTKQLNWQSQSRSSASQAEIHPNKPIKLMRRTGA